MNHALTALFGLLLFCLPAHVSAADIIVRAVNGKNGKPLSQWPVEISGKTVITMGFTHLLGKGDTDRDGRVVFHIEEPFPQALVIYVGMAGREVGCSDRFEFYTEEVVRSGILTQNRCDRKGKIKVKFEAKPGEIVVFARPFTRWDYLCQELPFC